jgi:pimeloyl-ACP methyl ester carboxylesterase
VRRPAFLRASASWQSPIVRTERFTFEGSQGDALAARLDLPSAEPRAMALFAHCFTCSQDSPAAARIARGLVAAGLGVLRFDFTGLGSSEGDFANTNFVSNVGDLIAAAAALRQRCEGPQMLIGHSLGGTAVLVAASRLPEVVAVVTINAPYDPAHVLRQLPESALSDLERNDEVGVEIGGRRFRIRREFLVAARDQDLRPAIASLGRPLLVLHAPTDEVVDVDNARRIFDAARHPKSFVSLDDADHLLTRRRDGTYVADVVSAWASRYFAGNEADGGELRR